VTGEELKVWSMIRELGTYGSGSAWTFLFCNHCDTSCQSSAEKEDRGEGSLLSLRKAVSVAWKMRRGYNMVLYISWTCLVPKAKMKSAIGELFLLSQLFSFLDLNFFLSEMIIKDSPSLLHMFSVQHSFSCHRQLA
jgi:hypothetical protein